MPREPHRPTTLADLQDLEGEELGASEWRTLSQELVDQFARLTGDEQWIHVDPTRASRSAFGTTIAHGLFSLSLGPAMMEELLSFEGFAHSLNYGYERIRFPSAMPVGGRVRLRARVGRVTAVGESAANVTFDQTFEREGADKPVCVAVQIARFQLPT